MLLRTAESARWRRRFWLALAVLIASYLIYRTPDGFEHGGSTKGVAYGALGTLAILILLYFGVRKRSYRSTWGSLESWLQSHIYLGFLSGVLILLHTGFRFHDKVALSAFGVLLLVVATGFWGAVLYTSVPRRLTEVESNLTAEEVSEQLNQLARTMARVASARSAPFQEVCKGLLAESVPRRFAGWRIVFGTQAARSGGGPAAPAPWAAHLAQVPPAEQPELRQLLVLSRQRKELLQRFVAEQRYRNLLDVWLYLHVPLSIALLALVAAHLIAVFYYSKL